MKTEIIDLKYKLSISISKTAHLVEHNIKLKEEKEELVSILTNIYQEFGVDRTLVFTEADIENIRTVLTNNK